MTPDSSSALVHVVFELEVADDLPPVTAERVWALDLGDGLFQIDNTPWFVRGIAAGDVVRAVSASSDQHPTFVERVRWSGGLTIRVIPFLSGALGGNLTAVLDRFTAVGAEGEIAGSYPIISLNLPPGTDLPPIKSLLRQGVADGWWEFEEGCVTDEWIAL